VFQASVVSKIREELAGELADNSHISDVRQGFDPRVGGDYLTVCYEWLGRQDTPLAEQYPDWQVAFCGLPVFWVQKYRPNLVEDPKETGCPYPAYIDGDGKNGYCVHCGKPARRAMTGFLHNVRESTYCELTERAYGAEREARMMDPSVFGRWFWDVEEVYGYITELLHLPAVVEMCDPESLAQVYFAVETMDSRYWPTGRLEWGRENFRHFRSGHERRRGFA
jgi:hypothetical protein